MMSREEFLEEIEQRYDIDDVLNILGQDYSWVFRQIADELWKHRKDFEECYTLE